ncbi:MAG: hypothetical protein J6A18_01255 [Alistipes sp.]|nr:hypothetical protein [Alistipes sp.]MBP3289571.1 hypothetical protein [Alistipes sp.]
MKRFFNIIWALAAVAAMLTACHKDDVVATQPDAPEGYMAISVPITMPDMSVVETRGVDPDGLNIHRIALFCFDQFGMFISHVNDVKLSTNTDTTGEILEALIPDATRRIHFVANQNTSTFDDSTNKGKSELEIMTTLEGSSGMMIYWGRYATEASTAAEFKERLLAAHGSANNPIRLLRNQAKVSVKDNANFGVAGFAVVNTNTFGTVAPRHPEKDFDFKVMDGNNFHQDWIGEDFVTLPQNKAKLTPPADVDNAPETYVFETKNTAADPVSVIIKGDDGEYYRAMLILDDEYKMVRRNHHYIINITGPLSYGSASFAEALEAPATNNVWLSIDDEVNEVRNADYILGVDQTEVVILAEPDGNGYNYFQLDENGKRTAILSNGIIELGYTFSDENGNAVADGPEVNWEDGNTVATDWLDNQYNASSTKHYIGIKLNSIDTSDAVQKAEGTILIKKGLLQRKIKVIVLKQQSFVPMWVTTQMYGGDTTPNSMDNEFVGSNVTIMFTVPEECPDEMLPFEVYVSVDHLDVRSAAGQPLPVIRKDDPRYGEDVKKHPNAAANSAEANEVIGYKYVYTVTQKGDQRIYFKNILDQTGNNPTSHNHSEYVTVESPYFATLSKPYVFAANNHTKAITITNLQRYNALNGVSSTETEYVYYMLVPQKKGAEVLVDVQLIDMANNANTPIHANVYDDNTSDDTFDEFLLYTEHLEHDNHTNSAECVAEMKEVTSLNNYNTSTKTYGLRFTKDWDNSATNDADKDYKVRMHTTKAKSAEVVRLASNQTGSPSAFSTGNYTGYTYRSRIFELANYRPFRFAAQVAGEGSFVDHDASEENVDAPTTATWAYGENTKVEVAFDITSFTANDGSSVDPFGRSFKVYIDAPMLDWDTDHSVYQTLQNANKIGTESDGRFYYIVDANRDTEKSFWSGFETMHKSNKIAGERKVLPFKAKEIVSTGKITISADPEEVTYDEKVFNISNKPIEGKITYGGQDVPAGSFVSFALISNNSRIGSMTITSAGSYELRLRPEYEFDWATNGTEDTITIDYQIGNETYSATIKDLATLSTTKDIALVKQ